MIEPAKGAARAEAPEAKELCQISGPIVQYRSKARMLYNRRTRYVAARSDAKRVSGLAQLLPRGRSETFFAC
jgi:hypothetical protein